MRYTIFAVAFLLLVTGCLFDLEPEPDISGVYRSDWGEEWDFRSDGTAFFKSSFFVMLRNTDGSSIGAQHKTTAKGEYKVSSGVPYFDGTIKVDFEPRFDVTPPGSTNSLKCYFKIDGNGDLLLAGIYIRTTNFAEKDVEKDVRFLKQR